MEVKLWWARAHLGVCQLTYVLLDWLQMANMNHWSCFTSRVMCSISFSENFQVHFKWDQDVLISLENECTKMNFSNFFLHDSKNVHHQKKRSLQKCKCIRIINHVQWFKFIVWIWFDCLWSKLMNIFSELKLTSLCYQQVYSFWFNDPAEIHWKLVSESLLQT